MPVIEQTRPIRTVAKQDALVGRDVAFSRVAVGWVEVAVATMASSLIPISLIWDYSWESSIGVDRVWSPPHLMTHGGMWLAALVGLWLALRFSMKRPTGDNAGVKLGPVYAPAGAWVLLWSVGLFELVFPLDLWWQQAYGLGAGIWSPPQILKAASFVGVAFGALTLVARGEGAANQRGWWMAWNCGMLLTLCWIMLGTAALTNVQHAAHFYKLCALVVPPILIIASVTGERWGATKAAGTYLLVCAVMVWVLPLFPAQPLTPPIHNPMDHFMPPQFPLLLLIPALVLDAIQKWRRRSGEGWLSGIGRSAASGVLFLIVFGLVQWWFARFLLSPSADNWVFAGGGKHWPYFLKIDAARTMFWRADQDPLTGMALMLTMMFAGGSAIIGFCVGTFLKRLRC